RHYLDDVLLQLRKYQALGEAAMAQVDDAALLRRLDPESNSIALLVKHMAGNMRSRWTDFLESDGEKPWRGRDLEFEDEGGETRARVVERWTQGWATCLAAIGALGPDDLARTVAIRGEPHTVVEAIQRQLTHYAYHVGQIVFLAKHFAGPSWRSLSIPRGRSADFEVAKDGASYRPEGGGG
ncbi:MAG: DUF1572 family protein, partial [Thermoanaerobaculia bacterium]